MCRNVPGWGGILKSSIIYTNVTIGSNTHLGEFCIIGKPPKGALDGELETSIGDNAVIRSHTVIYAGNSIGYNFNTGHYAMIREQNRIGNDVSIGTMSCIEHHVSIASGVRIHSQAFIPEFSILEDNCWIGPNAVLTNAKYPRGRDVKGQLAGPRICRNAKIGANATVLPGITIGHDALLGAGSVAVRDIEPYAIWAGNPARKIGDVRDNDQYEPEER